MKKLLSLMLAMLLTASVCAVSVHAAPTPLAAGNSKSSASLIPSYDVDYLSSLSYAKEEDWFKFQTVSNSAYPNTKVQGYSPFSFSQTVQK